MLYVTKAPPARSPSLRPAAPKRRPASKAAPPAAKPKAEPAALRRSRLQDDVVEALGAPPPPRASRTASSTKVAPAPTKAAGARKRATPALKSPAPLPEPRQAPARVVIKFPRLPAQVRAARYEAPSELQAQLVRFRTFLSVASMIAEARKLTSDEKHQVELARARIAEIQSLGLVGVR